MSTALYRPQPLPPVRLHLDMVVLVLALHGALLWMANVYWPLHAAPPRTIPDTLKSLSVHIFPGAGNRMFALNGSDVSAIGHTSRQRFGRTEAMLVLPNAQTRDSAPQTRAVPVPAFVAPDTDTPLKLGLTSRYIDRSRMDGAGHSLTSSKAEDNSSCLVATTDGAMPGMDATGAVRTRATSDKCQISK